MTKPAHRIKWIPLTLLPCLIYSLHADDGLQHPILSISSNSGSAANTILSTWTEAQYTNDFTPRYGPRNSGYGFAPAVISGDTGWSWSISSPTQIVSTPSGTVFPATNTALYPVRTQAVTTFTGDTVDAPYYLQAGSTSSKSFVFNLIAYNQQNQRDSDFGNLSGAYIGSGISPATRNDNYARRVAIELLDWGRWYPDYTLTGKNSATYINTSPTYLLTGDAQRASDHDGLAHEWSDTPLKAFDAIYDSVALTNLSLELGFNVRGYITTNVFFCEGNFFVNNVPVAVAIGSNLSGPYAVLPEIARVLNRPDYIVWMDQYLTAAITDNINRDGLNEEGQGYSLNYIQANITAAQNTRDYFLTRPATNSQFIAISNRAVVYAGSLAYGQEQWSVAALPNGQLASFGDTTFDTYFPARNAGNSIVLGSYGHVVMGAGTTSSTAMQVNQQYAGNQNHMRSDTTAFTLWAFNNPYLENVRYYNGAIGRNWGEQLLEKNAVVINRTDLSPFPTTDTYGNANLTLYEPGNNGLAMTEIDGYRDYSNLASRYQRLLFLNTVDPAKPYVVDVFRVTGGTNHDYTFHGAIRWTQTGQCSFPLVTNSNPYPMLEPGDAAWSLATDTPDYGFWRGVSSNSAPGNFYLTYLDTNRATARDTRLWMTADPDIYNVYLGWTPVPETNNTVPTNFFNHLNLTRPSAIIRHRVTSGTLSDLFVSVVEPFNAGVSNIVSVQRLPMSGSNVESCGLQIAFKDGRVDTYIVNLRNPKIAGATTGSATVSTADGQYTLAGRAALEMDRSNGDARVWTINATDFKYPGRELSTPTNTYYSGPIAGETRKFDGAAYDAFTTATPLPTGTALRGKSFSFTHGTMSGSGVTNISEMFKIDQVVFTNGLYSICFTNDHYLEITNSTTSVEQTAPLRTFTTSNSFEIALTAFAGQISPIADQNIPPGGSSGPINFSFGNLGATAGSSLQILLTSSNQTLVPNANLVLTGSGTNRSLTITPVAAQTGTSMITVSVTDGIWTNSRAFQASVGNFAIITSPASQTVLAGAGTTYTNVVVATNGTGIVSFSVNGLPAGASANFSPPTTAGAGTNLLTVTASTNSSPGAYVLLVTATAGSQSATNSVALVVNTITAAPGTLVWTNGAANLNWSSVANWTNVTAGGYGPPGPANNVEFTNSSTVGSTATVNNVVDGNFLIGTLQYNNNAVNTSPNYQVTAINSGQTLTVAGGVFAGAATDAGGGQEVNAVITGTNAALVLSNGVVAVTQGSTTAGAHQSVLDLSSLGVLVITNVSRLAIAVDGVPPQAGNGGQRCSGILYLAKTNSIAVTSTGITNGILVGWNDSQGNNGTGDKGSALYLGQASTIFADAIYVGTDKTLGCLLAFNPNGLNNPAVYVRGIGGASSRVSFWGIGDTSMKNGSNQSTSGTNDFTDGTVDALVNTMTIGATVTGAGSGANSGNGTGTLTFNAGTIDVNNLTNGWSLGTGTAAGSDIGTGTINVNGTATLNVNNILALAANTGTGTGIPSGTLNINGGTVEAAYLLGGGGTAKINLNSGTLDLQSGQITNLTSLNIGDGVSAAAQLINAGLIQSPNPVVIAANGTLLGNPLILSPDLLVNGSVSPGGAATGAITNSGDITLGAGGSYAFDMEDADGQAGTNWDLLTAGGILRVQATNTNPFLIQLRSIDGNLNDNNAGAADFGNDSATSWSMATAAGGLTNFAANQFTVDDSQFLNDLAGGYFTVQTNGNCLLLSFVPNHAPQANDSWLYLPRSGVLQIPISSLTPQWSDPDGDPVQFVSVNPAGTNGTSSASSDGTFIYYTNAANALDAIIYTVADVRTNPPAVYRPGDTVRTDMAAIHILPPPTIATIRLNAAAGLTLGGTGGIASGIYYLLASSNLSLPLTNWTIIATNAFDIGGNFSFTNMPSPAAAQTFYLLKLP